MANLLANVFGTSPVQPIEKHMDVSFRCARQLRPLFEAVIANDWDKALEVRTEIEGLNMPKSLFMPVPREDLLELLLVQDKIANRTKDVSGVIIGRRMQIP
jgi:predicted phosphate transport protein (TIGR00153 family)